MPQPDGQACAQPSIFDHDVGVSTQAPACSSQDQPASHKLAMLAFDPEHPSPHANALVVDMINTKVVVASAFITVLLSCNEGRGLKRKIQQAETQMIFELKPFKLGVSARKSRNMIRRASPSRVKC